MRSQSEMNCSADLMMSMMGIILSNFLVNERLEVPGGEARRKHNLAVDGWDAGGSAIGIITRSDALLRRGLDIPRIQSEYITIIVNG